MADYGEQFDEKLNHVNSLLREEPFGLETILPEGVPAEAIESGVFGGIDATTGIEWGQDKANTVSFLQSRNFATGSAGWRLDSDGNIEAESGEFRGTITATAGAIGGWNIVAGYIYSLQSGTPTSSPNDGLVMASGNEGIIVYENTEKRVELGYLSAGVYGLKLYEDDGSTVAIEFSDTQKYINGVNLGAATVASLATKIAIQGWSHDLVFSSSDTDTVAWAGGTITMSDGVTTYSITGANTGNMASLTYIYLDIGSSTTALQTSTTASDAVGDGKILIAVAQNQTDEATFQVFGGMGGLLLTTDNLAANTITANEIAANTITGTEISSLSISSKTITADTGTIGGWTLSGTTLANGTDIILDASNKKISINDTTFGNQGIQLDYNGGTPRFYVGDGAGNKIEFDGTNTSLSGAVSANILKIYTIHASDVYASSDGIVGSTSTSYVKVKEFTLGSDWASTTISVTFTLIAEGGNPTAYGRVYKNGAAVGTEQSTGGSTIFTESFAFVPGDLIQIYVKHDPGTHNAQVTNFRLLGNVDSSKFTVTDTT